MANAFAAQKRYTKWGKLLKLPSSSANLLFPTDPFFLSQNQSISSEASDDCYAIINYRILCLYYEWHKLHHIQMCALLFPSARHSYCKVINIFMTTGPLSTLSLCLWGYGDGNPGDEHKLANCLNSLQAAGKWQRVAASEISCRLHCVLTTTQDWAWFIYLAHFTILVYMQNMVI